MTNLIPFRALLGVSPTKIRAASWTAFAVGFGLIALTTLSRTPDGFFYMDDFIGIQHRGSTLSLAISPYGGHLSYSAGLLWFGWLEAFGTSSYTPFLVLAICLTGLNAAALSVTVSRLTNPLAGLAAAAWLLLLGPAFHNQLWDQASLAQLASTAVILVPVVIGMGRRGVIFALPLVVVGFGVGGLGFGVLVGFCALCLAMRKWAIAVTLIACLTAAVIIAAGSGAASAGGDPSLLGTVARIPLYVLSALQETIRLSLNVPTPMAGALAVGVIVVVGMATYRALSHVELLESRCLIISASYLLATWAIAGFVRGILEEVAAPRYLGVTAPVLLLACISSLVLLGPPVRSLAIQMAPKLNVPSLTVAICLVLGIAALSNTPNWLQARTNTSYLGSLNLARLAAMHAGTSWIAPAFKPSGEGLTYVQQDAIELAWSARGEPRLQPSAIATREHAAESATAFVTTVIEAGGVEEARSSATAPVSWSSCQRMANTNNVTPQSATWFRVRGSTDGVTAQALGSSAVPVPIVDKPGIYKLNPTVGGGQWKLNAPQGCISLPRAR